MENNEEVNLQHEILPAFYLIAAEVFAQAGDTSVKEALVDYLETMNPGATAEDYVSDIKYFKDNWLKLNPVITEEMAEDIYQQALKELEDGQ